MGSASRHKGSRAVQGRKSEKAAFPAQCKLLENFVSMARSPGKAAMMEATLRQTIEAAAMMTGAEKGSLFHAEPDRFSREGMGSVQPAGNRMGFSLENICLYQKIEKSHQNLDAAKNGAESCLKALNKELEKGHQIQKDFLPAAIPEIPSWEIKTCFQPAIQVAGDFYDVFRLPGNHIGLVVGDICDKGIGSALYMALLRSLIRIFSGQTQLCGLSIGQAETTADSAAGFNGLCDADQIRPLQAISLSNNYLLQNHSEMCMFATIFFGVLNPGSGSFAYINAGHPAPLIVNADGGIRHRLHATVPIVGVMPDLEVKIRHVRIDPEDTLVVYTDGVTDALSLDGEMFMEKRLETIASRNCTSAGEMISKIRAAIAAFAGNAGQHDDITILAARRKKATK